jgi:hypothetical protein
MVSVLRKKARPGAGGRAWPGPKLAERIKHRLPFALHVGEMLEETHFHSHIVGPISLSRSDPLPWICSFAPEICSFEPRPLPSTHGQPHRFRKWPLAPWGLGRCLLASARSHNCATSRLGKCRCFSVTSSAAAATPFFKPPPSKKSNDATVNPLVSSADERVIADT